MRIYWAAIFALLLSAQTAQAEQPIFDEMPRWSGGWGFQLLQDYRSYQAEVDTNAPAGFVTRQVAHRIHLQGVYTWHKSVRITAKLPYLLSQEREVVAAGGTNQASGLGNLTLALPLKRYFNLDGRSGSWTLAPQVRLPTARGENPTELGAGLGLGYETESYRYHFGVGGQIWAFSGLTPYRASLGLKLGLNVHGFGSSGHLKWYSFVQFDGPDSQRLIAGPIFYWRFSDLVHAQALWRHDFLDRSSEVGRHGDGDLLRLGIGFVF